MSGGNFGRLGEWTLTVAGVAYSTLKDSRLTIAFVQSSEWMDVLRSERNIYMWLTV